MSVCSPVESLHTQLEAELTYPRPASGHQFAGRTPESTVPPVSAWCHHELVIRACCSLRQLSGHCIRLAVNAERRCFFFLYWHYIQSCWTTEDRTLQTHQNTKLTPRRADIDKLLKKKDNTLTQKQIQTNHLHEGDVTLEMLKDD